MDKKRKIWFMRQAGRYLPEYREIRKEKKTFLDLCFSPNLACEVSLQPIKRFDFDFIILFSDILVIPHALSQKVSFEENIGPILEKRPADLTKKKVEECLEILEPVFRTIELIKKTDNKKKLIGFCGGPFTVFNYMIELGTSKTHAKVKKFMNENIKESEEIVEKITEISIEYLKKQIDSGVDYVKIFDSWAGLIEGDQYERFVIEPNRIIKKTIKKYSKKTKVICFPRGSKEKYLKFLKVVKPDILSLDNRFPEEVISYSKKNRIILQGNLDPVLLKNGGNELYEKTQKILKRFKENNHIFNLSHGILPQTPIENVKLVVETVRSFSVT